MKKIISMMLVAVLTLSLAACGGKSTETADGPKKCQIGVALYADNGPGPEATKAYLDSLADTLNVEFSYIVLSQTDESANLTKVQELIATGVDGIICTLDIGTESMLKECQDAGVYMAGYLCDYNSSYTTNYDAVFKNEYFLGTVADGACGDDLDFGYTAFEAVKGYNEAHADDPVTHISMAKFPSWIFPNQDVYVEQFTEKIEEYNQTAENPITLDPLNEESDVLQFTMLDSTYFTKHDGIDAIVSFAAGDFIYPTMVSTGYDATIKLFCCGYDGVQGENFGSNGTKTYQLESQSAIEAINYPLVLLLNKINGVEFKDMPENAERVSCSVFVLDSDEAMETFKTSLYVTGNAEDALFTAEDVLNMTAFGNPDATYAGLMDTLSHMTIEDIK